MKNQLTSHRKTVFEVVKESMDHPTARQVFDRAVQKSPRLSFATVYNSLKYLSESGLIKQVSFGEEAIRYDARLSRHDHLFCRVCHKVLDLMDIAIPTTNNFSLPKGFKVEEISLKISGLCESCQEVNN
ncbi:MAG: transcriptional repressor [Acidobacteria bacterium]|nr:transcriptional repressor [Acidobacteriota bacterium]